MAISGRTSPWQYHPSTVASVLSLLVFFALTAALCWRAWKARAKFCIAFALGGFFEFVGYVARAAAGTKTDRLMPFIMQNFFILVAPALFAASIYMTLGRVMRMVGAEQYSLIRFRWLTKIFVGGDMLSFFVQGSSAPLMFIAQQKYMKLGEGIVIAGLFIQLIMFGLFVVTSVVLEIRLKSRPTNLALANMDWKKSMRMLYCVSGLIIIRSIFRIVEYTMGYNGYLLQHEWSLYVFDTLLMAGVMAVFLWLFPGNIRLPLTSNEEFDYAVDQQVHVAESKG